jgi:hypothetical protein
MEQWQVVDRLHPSSCFGDDVIDFHGVSIVEEQFALPASSSLSFQESGDSCRDVGMASEPAAPIDPVSVIWTSRALYLHMSPDRRVIMAVQAGTAVGRLKRPAFPVVDSPVCARRPAFLLVWMTLDGPGAEPRIEHVTKALKDSCADDVRIELGPADNHGIQLSNQRFLIRVLLAVHRLPEFLDMSLDSCLAGLDARFAAMQASPAVLPRLGFSDRVLSDVKAAAVKP